MTNHPTLLMFIFHDKEVNTRSYNFLKLKLKLRNLCSYLKKKHLFDWVKDSNINKILQKKGKIVRKNHNAKAYYLFYILYIGIDKIVKIKDKNWI